MSPVIPPAVATTKDRPWKGGEALRNARTCYDHLAGRLGVAIADSLTKDGSLILGDAGGELTASGAALLAEMGVDLRPKGKRAFCRCCLDWSERRTHIAGTLGASLAARAFELGWITRAGDTRALAVTPAGVAGFQRVFGPIPALGA